VAVDILCGVLAGGGFGTGVKSLFQEWNEPQHIGHLFITIDPQRFMPLDIFQERIKALYRGLKSASPIDSDAPVVVAAKGKPVWRYKERARGYLSRNTP
jgi:LDH2 family malate/lactate/ureidoglycolate dehydrogenase